MTVNQVYTFVNTATQEALGQTALVTEDLSNVVDVGTAIFNANAVDAYVKSLVNHIGKVIFVDRKYRGAVPSILMDGWEYGSVLEKITADLPVASENESWNLQNGSTYETQTFYQPSVSAKFYNKKVTFEIDMSFTELQVKQSFKDAQQLNAFISMLYNEIEKSMTIKMDELVMRAINNMTAEAIYSGYSASTISANATSVRAINLLFEYKQEVDPDTTLTKATCIYDKDFIRYAVYKMALVKSRMARISTLYNNGGKARFTPEDALHLVVLSDFKAGCTAFLQSDTYHDELVKLPAGFEDVPYWQGSGTGYALSDTSKVNVTTADGHSVSDYGIIGVMFDRDAVGVANLDRRVTTSYNPKGEFYTNFYKFDAGFFNDGNENFVVFCVA